MAMPTTVPPTSATTAESRGSGPNIACIQSEGLARTTKVAPSSTANCHFSRQRTGMSSGRAGRIVQGGGADMAVLTR
jgi:hypothetical protein